MPLNLIVTEEGRAALLNAEQTGTDAVIIVEAGLSAAALTPTPDLTALPGELRRVATVGGTGTADDVIHVSILDDSDEAYTLRSFALYLDDGRLFAIYGQAGPILTKTATSTALIAIDCIFADIAAASVTFGDTNFTDPNATTARRGLIEIATNAEAQAGADTARALTPAALAAALLPLLLARDGAGSGIDADLLDGQHGSYYTQIAARLGFTPVNRAGDTMTGPLVLPADPAAAGQAARKAYVDGLVTAAAILAKLLTVDGAGSGLDADLLDGQHANAFVPVSGFTAAAILAKLITADGAGSGLDADLLDGQHAAAFLTLAAFTGSAVLAKLVAVDGAGSGLDADMVDGKHAAAFAQLADFSTGSNANGRWWKTPDGGGGAVIEQQGIRTGISGVGIYTINFPTPFQTTNYVVLMNAVIPGGDDYDNFPQEVAGSKTTNSVQFYVQDTSSGGIGSLSGVSWRAKGY